MQKTSRVRKRFSPAQRERVLAAYGQSQLTQKEFARQSGISLSCLRNWLARRSAPGLCAAPGWIELPSPAGSAAPGRACRIESPGGWSVEIDRGWPAAELAWLCQMLKSL